jgi:hypothetical protein
MQPLCATRLVGKKAERWEMEGTRLILVMRLTGATAQEAP